MRHLKSFIYLDVAFEELYIDLNVAFEELYIPQCGI